MNHHLSILVPCRDFQRQTAYAAHMAVALGTQRHWYGKHGIDAGFSFWSQGQCHVHIARWELLKRAFDVGATEILWLDDDAVPPVDVYERLARHDVDMIVPWFTMRTEPPVCPSKSGRVEDCEVNGAPARRIVVDKELAAPDDRGLVPLITSGLHCCLMKADVARDVVAFRDGGSPFTFVSDGRQATMGEDAMFFQLAAHVGRQLWLDPSIKVWHVGDKMYG